MATGFPNDRLAPIDMDCTHKSSHPAVVCYYCQQLGHYAKECLQAFNIQTMTLEERLEMIPELLALANMPWVGSELRQDAETLEEPEIAKEELSVDFANCSG